MLNDIDESKCNVCETDRPDMAEILSVFYSGLGLGPNGKPEGQEPE